VLGGMGSATLLGIFFVPLFYLWVKQRFSRGKTTPTPDDAAKPSEVKP
jgi:hypothetical protein